MRKSPALLRMLTQTIEAPKKRKKQDCQTHKKTQRKSMIVSEIEIKLQF